MLFKKKNNDHLSIAIGNLVTLGIEQYRKPFSKEIGEELASDYEDVILTLDQIEAIGMSRGEAWDIICGWINFC